MGSGCPKSVVGDMNQATQANWKAGLRTTILLASLTGLLVGLGYLIGGPSTALTFLFIGLAINLVMFWFSDKIALKMSRARPLSEEEAPRSVRRGGFYAILPMLPELQVAGADEKAAFTTEFSSGTAPLGLDDTAALLKKHRLMPGDADLRIDGELLR